MRPIACISRATLDSETLDPARLGSWQHVWATKRFQGYLWGTKPCNCSAHKALESTGKVRDHNESVQRLLEFLTVFDYTLEYRKGSANGNFELLSRLPELATPLQYSIVLKLLGSESNTPGVYKYTGNKCIAQTKTNVEKSSKKTQGPVRHLKRRPEMRWDKDLPAAPFIFLYMETQTDMYLYVRIDAEIGILVPQN